MQKGFADKWVSVLLRACHSSVPLASPMLSLKWAVEKSSPLINVWCQRQCPYLTLDPALTEDPNKVELSFCSKPNVSLVNHSWWPASPLTGSVSETANNPHQRSRRPFIWLPTRHLHAQLWQARFLQEETGKTSPQTDQSHNVTASACVAPINMCINAKKNQPRLCFCPSVQCWSSRGRRRGQCWCVDQNGLRVSSDTGEKGSLAC